MQRSNTKKTLLLVGDDRIGHLLIQKLQDRADAPDFVLNRSGDLRRIWKLLRHNVLTVRQLADMFFAEKRRPDYPAHGLPGITTNAELEKYILHTNPDQVLCFRAGLILNAKILALGPQILNIHCATLPQFGGIGSIHRALTAKAYDQYACLHLMEEKIDKGEVIHREPYCLDPGKSYRSNEDEAYAAGMRLIGRFLDGEQTQAEGA